MKDYFDKLMSDKKIPLHMQETVREEICHGIEVSNLAVMIARELGEDKNICRDLTIAGILHDIGKLKLTDYLYSEEDDTLLIEQMKYVRMHSTYSYKILKNAGYPDNIAEAVYHHHENYDGSGYPDNLRGKDIPIMSRILRTCDVFAALTADRSYRNAFDEQSAVEIMIDEVADYDMEIFLAFQRIIHKGEYNGMESLKEEVNDLQKEHIKLFIKEAEKTCHLMA